MRDERRTRGLKGKAGCADDVEVQASILQAEGCMESGARIGVRLWGLWMHPMKEI